MSSNSNIEWTDASWQPISGCSRKSTGCENCYAERMAGTRLRHQKKYEGLTRMTSQGPKWTGITRLNEDDLLIPLKWKKPRRIFVCSMADLFHESVPFEWIDKVFAVMALCPQHTFQVLTKRPERMAEYLNFCDLSRQHPPRDRVDYIAAEMNRVEGIPWTAPRCIPGFPGQGFIPNIWLGTSCENQETADERIPHLLSIPCQVRFLSCEPLLGEIDLGEFFDNGFDREVPPNPYCPDIHWVIVGGESGPKARPCTIGHIRSIVKQCKAANVRCFVKQLGSNPVNREGERHPIKDHHDIDQFPEDLQVREYPGESR